MRLELKNTRNLPALIQVWLALSAVFAVILVWGARLLYVRKGAAPERFSERLGHASVARPSGRLIWVHAGSVGEVTSIAKLARRLSDKGSTAVLVTTTTATGALTVARLVPGAVHQFLPVDTPAAVQRFLDHWRPDAALFVEADLWPRMILSLEARDCPMALLNARASRSRTRFPAAYAALLAPMQLITVQDAALVDEFFALGLDPSRIHSLGNLKADIDVPAVDEELRACLSEAGQVRGIWAAVSTHVGEETLLLDAHAGLASNPLLILVPRHPERGDTLAKELAQRGVKFSRHSRNERPDTTTAVHLVDVLGETGTVYAAAGLAFVGGSLSAGRGGHTPYEPIALGCAILSGPYVQNFSAAYATLQAAGAAERITNTAALGLSISALLADDAMRSAMQIAACRAHASQQGATERAVDALIAVLPKKLDPPRQA